MSHLREWGARVLSLFRRRRRTDRDLSEELLSHLELAAESERLAGANANDARRLAALRHGSVSTSLEILRDRRLWRGSSDSLGTCELLVAR